MLGVPFHRQVALFFLPAALLVIGAFAWFYVEAKKDLRASFLDASETQINHAVHLLEKDLTLLSRDVRYLANSPLLQQALQQPNAPEIRAHLAQDWQVLMQASSIYDQIRWLDASGLERLRINFVKGQPHVVPKADLQDKSKRYYFRETMRLGRDQLFFSPFDLNVEAGEVERPLKPTLRLATPVYDAQNRKQGMVIVNYNGTQLLQGLGELNGSAQHALWLLNHEGYWLRATQVCDEWGFMLDKPEASMPHRYPEAWAQILAAETGWFNTPEGLWSFQTVAPVAITSLTHKTPLAGMSTSADLQWKLVSFVSKITFTQALMPIRAKLMLLGLGVLGLLYWGVWHLVRSRMGEVKRVRQEVRHQVLRQKNAELNQQILHRQEAENHLFLSLERYMGVLKTTPEGFLLIDESGTILEVNEAFCQLADCETHQIMGQRLTVLAEVMPVEAFMDKVALLEQGGFSQFELRFCAKQGGHRDVAISLSVIEATRQVCAFLRDVTQQNVNEFQLKMAASVFTHAKEGIILTDSDSKIIEVNSEFERITGYPKAEVLGKNPKLLNSGRQSKAFYDSMKKDLATKGHWYGELWNRRKTGELYLELLSISRVDHVSGDGFHYVGMFTDVTLERQYQKSLEHISHYDALTGLPNRLLLTDRINQAMARAHRKGKRFGVAFIDLDCFKRVNDLYGHAMADQLLVHLAKALKTHVRETDTVARFGGDEFVAVIQELDDPDDLVPLLNKLLEVIAEPLEIDGTQVSVGASIGVTFFPQPDTLDGEQLVRQADQAMYIAKQAGKNQFHIFDVLQDKNLRYLNETINEIETAIEQDQLVLHYQPKVDLTTGKTVGVEALIRWQHPQKGLQSPNDFLPAIEQHPLSVKLTEWVMRHALLQIRQWKLQGLHLPVSINVGGMELQQQGFLHWFRQILNEFPDVEPFMLDIEVLETSALADVQHVSNVIEQCRELGVLFELDDFGTGFASLSYLKKLPLETIKIDQVFVRHMFDEEEDIFILEGMIGLAKSLDRAVIAEGIETEAHGVALIDLGCRIGQGFFIAKPMPASNMAAWLEQWKPPASWTEPRVNRASATFHTLQ